jgi:hypothetical protein
MTELANTIHVRDVPILTPATTIPMQISTMIRAHILDVRTGLPATSNPVPVVAMVLVVTIHV